MHDASTTGNDDPLLRAALLSMPYGFSIWGDDRRLLLFNQHYIDMYRFPAEKVILGMSLLEICELTVAIGNHPGVTAEELNRLYEARFAEAQSTRKVVRSQKPIRDRVMKTSHIFTEGLGWVVMHEDISEEIAQQQTMLARDKSLADQALRFEAAVDNMRQGLCMFDKDERLVICNAAYGELYALPPELMQPGALHADIVAYRTEHGMKPVDGGPSFMSQHWALRDDEQSRIVVVELANGKHISIHHQPMTDGGWVATHQDVTEERHRLAALEARERDLNLQNIRFDAAINNMSQGLCMFDKDERLVVCNTPYAAIYNLPPELVRPGTTLTQIMNHRFSHGMVPLAGRRSYVASRKQLVANRIDAKDLIEMEDGRTIAIQHHPLPDGGWVATHEDITEQKRTEARIRRLARHDALTDLPNRIVFREEMVKLESRIERQENVAVLCLDLDHFKAVNDTLGHAVGDQVLINVGQRLREAVRETDIVARLGGDEFSVLAHSLGGPADAATLANRIVRLMAEPMEVDGHHIAIGTSIGIAMAPADGHDTETLLKNADMALYRAKSEGRGNYHFFAKGMDEALHRRRALEQGMKVALMRDEFRLMYQPLMKLSENRVCCLEALLRWDHPEHGLISPAEFIPVAEETGSIVAIGEWVLNEACRTAVHWPENVRVAVNLSPIQFKKPGLVDQVARALAASGLPASRLELEITESLLLAETDQTLEILHQLRALGTRISMDDFGTGYSSLSYLRAFPFDKIKIDRSFMNERTLRGDSLAIIKAVIGLGQNLGMSTTAEGIETEEQLQAVRDQGCDEVQGFLFSAPLPSSGVDALLGIAPPKGKTTKRKRA